MKFSCPSQNSASHDAVELRLISHALLTPAKNRFNNHARLFSNEHADRKKRRIPPLSWVPRKIRRIVSTRSQIGALSNTLSQAILGPNEPARTAAHVQSALHRSTRGLIRRH